MTIMFGNSDIRQCSPAVLAFSAIDLKILFLHGGTMIMKDFALKR